MARKARTCPAGYVYHVLNRSAGRIPLFRKEADFAAMERILLLAKAKVDLPLLAWCFMRNHWHFVVMPRTDTQVTDFFRWMTHTHAMRWRVAHRTVGWGHLYQGRFKSFPVQANPTGSSDGCKHFLTVCRYVQRNAATAGVVKQAQAWRWGSFWVERHGTSELRGLLSPWPINKPRNWLRLVNEPLTATELARVRLSVTRGQPYGEAIWVNQTVNELGLEHTVRSEGRPPNDPQEVTLDN